MNPFEDDGATTRVDNGESKKGLLEERERIENEDRMTTELLKTARQSISRATLSRPTSTKHSVVYSEGKKR